MQYAETNNKTDASLNTPNVGPRFGLTKLAAITRCTLTLAVLSALLISGHPAQGQNETVLYNFAGSPDGEVPASGLTPDGAGNFYGTTYFGGSEYGTVFELSPNGSGGWNETVLHSFTGYPGDGSYPLFSPMLMDSAGNLYGTTLSGGSHGPGTVFELSPAGGSWTETILYNFCPQSGCADGSEPVTNLIVDAAGNLYGVTLAGGANGKGGVFELSPSGGGWTEQVIYSFTVEPAEEWQSAGLTMDAAGNLYGTNYSTVFKLAPNGNGGWNPTVLHTFTGSPDAINPVGNPVLDKAGNLYGATLNGGTKNDGTVYKLIPEKNGTWKEEVLLSFVKQGSNEIGTDPYAGVVLDAAGNLYGTTTLGGSFNGGTVYELVAPSGKGKYKEKILWSLTRFDGFEPWGGLIWDSAGNLYGTCEGGGLNAKGVVFEMNLSAVLTKTTTTLSTSPNPSQSGQPVTFTAVVSPAPPDGETVTFLVNAQGPLTGTLSGGTASVTTSLVGKGTYLIIAEYLGDANFDPSVSSVVKQKVE